MAIKASAHAVYDLKYHFVWIPKYRKQLLVGAVAEELREILQRVAETYDMEIDTMEIMEEHVHVFISVPPHYSPDRVMQIMKSISAGELFARFPWIKGKLWGGEMWGDGYSFGQ